MPSKPDNHESRFLALAIKAINGTIAPKERQDLESILNSNQQLATEFSELKFELRNDAQMEFTVLCVRVLLKIASAEEVRNVRSLKANNPPRWEQFQQIAFLLSVLVESAKLPAPRTVPKEKLKQAHESILAKIKQDRKGS